MNKVIDKLPSVMSVDELAEIAAEEGVTIREVLKLLAKGMESKTVPRLDTVGRVIPASVVDDMPTQHKFMQSAAEILRLVRKEVVGMVVEKEHKYTSEDLVRMEGIAKELVHLEEIRRNSPMQRGEAIDVKPIGTEAV